MNNRKRYSNRQIAQALQDKFGKVCEAADALGCHPDTIYERAKTSRAVARALRYWPQRLLDNAQEGLDYHVEMQEPWAIKFVLKTLGKHRGYSERPLPPEPEAPLPPPRPRPNISLAPADPLRLADENCPPSDQRRLEVEAAEPQPLAQVRADSKHEKHQPEAPARARGDA